ncbi:GIY-YIG nuclease family protein [Patescibacteria group bacterium]|nr:GIY-YIG nuclease family protein [Candidatus Falkowbacteria bacterium]MBU3906370.1 GIY-YIG nuclease family protein [Patescibacteria group bacterium]MCG2697571.1 GIY-YIG nuclease family protein [Candidatus Parcubacteria bacterium]MBU4014651.1 GIY-YIG nuclease family protein [Patescibacteria group bacterium]MBU4026760.1 GIY-YIG nuclease family protein [Patescibacteria group bacterium]
MHYVYILKSLKDLKLYIGYTNNLVQRLKKHNNGEVVSTKHRRPLVIVYCEAYRTEKEARERERQLKQYGKAYAQLKRRIGRSINSVNTA